MNQTILFFGDEGILKDLAKKGSETDIRYYNTKISGDEISFLYPFKFPERIQTLLNAASVANKAILTVGELDKSIGEFLLTLDYHRITTLGIIADPTVVAQIQKITSGMGISVHPLTPKFEDLEKFAQLPVGPSKEENMVVLDQSFQVKGVGTVSLGFVLGGQIRKHMVMKAYPSGKSVDIKSIQIMDVDMETANPFSRVGLAYRNSEVDDVPKGTILYSREGIEFTESVQLNVRTNPTVKVVPSVGEKIQLNFLFNNINAEISDISEGKYLIDVDKKVPIIDEIFSITSLNSSPRVIGAGKPGN
ncbi:MAG: EF-Tu/IF-2/RF-3 family GTPase [Thermoplasmata archaeon]